MMHALLNAWLRGPDHPSKLRLFRWFVKRFSNSQVRLRVNESALLVSIDDFIGSKVIFDGNYEYRSLEKAQNLMRDGGLFIDVGSNFGLYSILLSATEGVKVIAIEPDEYNFSQLRTNTLNNNRSNIILCNTALSNSDAILPFELPCRENLGSVRITSRGVRMTADPNIVYRSATTFDRLAIALNVEEITLMKIDVEGHELAVLQGIDWSAKYKPRNIICEFLDHAKELDGSTRQDVYNFLVAKGYEGFDVEGNAISGTSDTIEYNAWFRLI